MLTCHSPAVARGMSREAGVHRHNLIPEAGNPPLLLPEFASVADVPGPWLVAHTMSRREKRLAFECLRREITYFLPLEAYQRRGHRFLVPIFAGYVFVSGKNVDDLRTSEHFCNMIHALDQATLCRELSHLEQVCKAEPRYIEHVNAEKLVGHKVEIIDGPFAHHRGDAIYAKREVVMVQITMFGRSTPVEVDTTKYRLAKMG